MNPAKAKTKRPKTKKTKAKKQSANKRIIVQVTIGPRGDVRDVWTVTRKYRNSKLAKCIERKIEAWRFPAFSGSAAVIEQPIDLSVIDK